MRAAKLTAIGKIELEEYDRYRAPQKNEVAIQVKAVGICGTDLHIFKSGRADVTLPRIMGHELSGVVCETGSEAGDLKVGDRVILDPVFACGTCKTCRSDHPNVCNDVKCFGVQMDGGFQDVITVPADQVYKFPDHISFEQAALAEPFSVAANILDRLQAGAKENMVIMGAGTIGLAVLQGAKARGVRVLVSDIEDAKLAKAQEMDADMVVNSKVESIEEAVERFSPGGADLVLDAVGAAALTEVSVRLAAPRARIGIISFDAKPAQIPAVLITKKELTLVGSRMNCHKFPDVIQWLEEDALNLNAMISRVYPLEQIQQAFEDTLANGKESVKTIITF